MKLYTNSNDTRLGIRLAEICKNTKIDISVAFFHHSEFILKCIENNCILRMIVRLENGTDPYELLKIVNHQKIDIRYYNGNRFHPKLYIVHNVSAILGSSNLTKSGLWENLELNIEVESTHPLYDDLKSEYYNEWKDADVLTLGKAKEFKDLYEKNKERFNISSRFFASKMGEVQPQNINIIDKRSKEKEFIEKFQKDYQFYISSFNRLAKMYIKILPKRKFDEELPIRIEIDRFLSWIKDTQYIGEEYKERPELIDEDIFNIILPLKKEFIEFTDGGYYDNTINRFNQINSTLSSEENIKKLDIETLYDVLLIVNAFHDRFRFFDGSFEAMKKEFLENDHDKIKDILSYIIYGKENYIKRIFNVIYDPAYKLKNFGESCVKELFGYVNKENIPTCNGRMLRSMQWLGFGNL
jgi:HKD family nuclease